MKGRKSERLEKRAAALRDNLRRRKPKKSTDPKKPEAGETAKDGKKS